jgi:hypothetical protein
MIKNMYVHYSMLPALEAPQLTSKRSYVRDVASSGPVFLFPPTPHMRRRFIRIFAPFLQLAH